MTGIIRVTSVVGMRGENARLGLRRRIYLDENVVVRERFSMLVQRTYDSSDERTDGVLP